MRRRESPERLVKRRPVRGRAHHQRLIADSVTLGILGVPFLAIGILASVWWLTVIGLVLLAGMAGSVVWRRRGPRG